jgi:hypothetical protein
MGAILVEVQVSILPFLALEIRLRSGILKILGTHLLLPMAK